MSAVLIVRNGDGELHVAGELHRGNAGNFGAELLASARGVGPPLVVDLFELELDDAAAVVAAVDALRALVALGPVTVRHAPHWLAHSLYRINALGDGAIVLEAPREEEPYG
jgi:anti-anti-sigma regulatory factor